MREEFHSMLLPSRTAALEGVAAVRGQLQGRKQAAWPLNSSSVLSALAQTVPNRPQLVPDKFWCLFLCARCCRPCSQRLTFAWLVPVHLPSATLHGAVYHSVRKNSFESVSYGTTSLALGPLCGGQRGCWLSLWESSDHDVLEQDAACRRTFPLQAR